jgi:hemerythrin-like domain-containing protein
MKRHPSLRNLSADHHHGLVQAQQLLHAVPAGGGAPGETDPEQVAGDFLRFFAAETTRHFREEEEVLLPAFARYGDPADPAIVQMLVEHGQLRRLAGDLHQQRARGELSRETMRATGALLQAHIRQEEQRIFPLIERSMPEDALDELARQLAGRGSSLARPGVGSRPSSSRSLRAAGVGAGSPIPAKTPKGL